MKIKDIEQFLPKYSDGSGFDVQIVYNTDKYGRYAWCEHDLYRPKTKPDQRELTIKALEPGIGRFGGNYDDTFAIIVEESEPVKEVPELVELEEQERKRKYEEEEKLRQQKEEQEERETFERLCHKYQKTEK